VLSTLKEEWVMWKKNFCWCKLLCVAPALLCIVLFSPSYAAEFSADTVQTTPQGVFKGKFFVKENNFRQETEMQGQKQIMIFRQDKDTVWMLMPREKMYMEMKSDPKAQNVPQIDPQTVEDMAEKKYLGTETVNGYVCEKNQYIYHDKSMGTMTQWFSKELNFPIKMEMDGPSGHMTSEYKNIEEKKLSDSLFEIPAGYQKMSIPGMGGMMEHMSK
jgi:outer membrane lipoprotein-sorting protein